LGGAPAGIHFRGVEKIEDVGAVVARQPAQSADEALICERSRALRKPTEISAAAATSARLFPRLVRKRRNRRPIARRCGARLTAPRASALATSGSATSGSALQYLNNRGGVKSANLAQVARFLQQVHVVVV